MKETQENKELFLIDLCARVPYHPKGHVVNACNGAECEEWLTCATFSMFTSVTNNCRLYLRPMSSMTEKEKEKDELFILCTMGNGDVNSYWESFGIEILSTHPRYGDYYSADYKVIDWLNKNMFDYRGLIPKGLAIEITDENNPYKD